ncbi:30S ribosomal protein S14 [Candidatus Vidania fulgoroideorum]
MSKKSVIQRENKRKILFKKNLKKRVFLKSLIKSVSDYNLKRVIYFKIQRLSRNSNPTRKRNRCTLSGRPRGYIGFFGISRILIRNQISNCEIPGFSKSSW